MVVQKRKRGRPRDALRHYSRIDGLLTAEASPTLRGALAANRANALEAVHRYRAAERHFEAAGSAFTDAGADHTVAQVEYNRAYGEMLRGRYQDSLRRYAGIADVFERLGDERHLAHVDLYRVESREELELAGFADLIGPGAVVAVEWGDRFPEALPPDRLEISIRRPDFGRDPAARVLSALGYGAVSEAALASWRAALAPE